VHEYGEGSIFETYTLWQSAEHASVIQVINKKKLNLSSSLPVAEYRAKFLRGMLSREPEKSPYHFLNFPLYTLKV
jgi:hypothetical protein